MHIDNAPLTCVSSAESLFFRGVSFAYTSNDSPCTSGPNGPGHDANISNQGSAQSSHPSGRCCTPPCVNLHTATHNVMSMREHLPHEGTNFSMLAQSLHLQHAAEQLHVVCLQEGRRPEFARCSANFYVLTSGDLNGQYGCELWFSLDSPYLEKLCFFKRFFV